MNKRYYFLVFLVLVVILASACKRSGASGFGAAPRTPFIGGTTGLLFDFETGNPPLEVTDDGTFDFQAIVRIKNQGESTVEKDDMIRLNLLGFDPNDFKVSRDDIVDAIPDDDLLPMTRDAEGNILEGTTTFTKFPRFTQFFNARQFSGNTEFLFRSELCYLYQTRANARLCILKDMINIRQNSICIPNVGGGSTITQSGGAGFSGASAGGVGKLIQSSSGPVQVANFRQSVVGADKLIFSFDIILAGNVDIFRNEDRIPITKFEEGCPKNPRERREKESKVGVTVFPASDNILSSLTCGGLNSGNTGVVQLINGKRTITCTVQLNRDRVDLEKIIEINLDYNVFDFREKRLLVKHLTSDIGDIQGPGIPTP